MQSGGKTKKPIRISGTEAKKMQDGDLTKNSTSKNRMSESIEEADDADLNYMRFTSTPTGSMSQFNIDNGQSFVSKSRASLVKESNRKQLKPKSARILFHNTKVFPDNFQRNNYGKWMMEVVQRKRYKNNEHLAYQYLDNDLFDTTKDSNRISNRYLKTDCQTASYITDFLSQKHGSDNQDSSEFKRTFTLFEPVFHVDPNKSPSNCYYYNGSTKTKQSAKGNYTESTDIFRPFRNRGCILKSNTPRENLNNKNRIYYESSSSGMHQMTGRRNPFESIFINAKALKYPT